jgi:glycosyltransferase involved in cell wall biosynthesis
LKFLTDPEEDRSTAVTIANKKIYNVKYSNIFPTTNILICYYSFLYMKIIYTYDIFTVQRYGGISRYYFELIKRIPPRTADVKIMAGLYINEYIKTLPVTKGIKVPALHHTAFIRQKINKAYQAILLKKLGNYDIAHLTFYDQPYIEFNGKIIVTIYDMISELYPQFFSSKDNTSLLKKQCCERADKIIAISHSTKNDLVKLFGIMPEKIDVIHLASSLPINNILHNIKPFGEPYLLFVGFRHYYKNFDKLIQAVGTSNSLKKRFHVICFGGPPFSSQEIAHFRALEMTDRIHQVSGNDALLCNYYKNAVALICPSLYEGFGIPILEAMQFSCPVVCSDRGSLPEVAGDAAIYFDPSDPGSIKKTLETVLFDDIILNDLKRKGLKNQSRFSWDRCAHETIAVYNSLLH